MTDKDVFVSFLTLSEAYKWPDLYSVSAETEEISTFPKCLFVISSKLFYSFIFLQLHFGILLI